MKNVIEVTNGSVPETMETFKAILAEPEKMFEMLRVDLSKAAERAVSKLIELELTGFLGRETYEGKSRGNKNYRNGSYQRTYTAKGLGTLRIEVKRDRRGKFNSKLIKRYDRYDKALAGDMLAMFF